MRLVTSRRNEVTRERAQSFLTDDHIERVVKAYERFKDEPGFTRVVTLEEIRVKDANLSIPLYVAPASAEATASGKLTKSNLSDALEGWLESSENVKKNLKSLINS